MRTFALFGAKIPDFSKFMVCPHGQGGRGVKAVRTFFGQKGMGSIFRKFLRTSFMDGPLRSVYTERDRGLATLV